MSLFGSIGLAAAQRLERSVGPTVALRSYKALLGGDLAVSGEAALGAMRCAIALRDEPELRGLCSYWETLPRLDATARITALALGLCAEGRTAEAAIITAAEAGRARTGAALYLHARVLEHGDEDAELAYREASAAKDSAIACAATCRLLELMEARGDRGPEPAQLAMNMNLSAAPPRQKLIAAKARLGSASRFARASALSILEELAAHPDDAIAAHAIIAAARHADEMGAALSWVESDRVVSSLRRWRSPEVRDATIARLEARRLEDGCAFDAAHLERARATLAGHAPPPVDATGNLATANHALDAVSALTRGKPEDSLEPLARLREALAPHPTIIPAAWTAVLLALRTPHRRARATALPILHALVARARAAPRQGFAAFARAARIAGDPDLALAALRRAAASGEPDAKSHLITELAARGWQAAERRDNAEALALLREARALAD